MDQKNLKKFVGINRNLYVVNTKYILTITLISNTGKSKGIIPCHILYEIWWAWTYITYNILRVNVAYIMSEECVPHRVRVIGRETNAHVHYKCINNNYIIIYVIIMCMHERKRIG
jgi:hypothetical protein